MIGAWKNVDDIDWESLPNRFVLKSNAQSDGRCIRFITDKFAVDWSVLKEELRSWLIPCNTLVQSYCRAYYDVTPMIIAEEYFEQLNGQLYDYKFWCFNGEPEFAYVATYHFANGVARGSNVSLYDLQWNKLPIKYGEHPGNDVPAPKYLTEMIEVSKMLSKEFPFVRVDFFETADNWYLSELTFYPGGGFQKIDKGLLKKWGEMFQLPPKNKLGRKYRFDLL